MQNQHASHRYHYDKVYVHLIYWANSDDPGFKSEAQELKALFQDLHYVVDEFEIPRVDSQGFLTSDIFRFWERIDDKRTLGIIHYGGHADRDDGRTSERRAVWAS